jgi:hypothetical protein
MLGIVLVFKNVCVCVCVCVCWGGGGVGCSRFVGDTWWAICIGKLSSMCRLYILYSCFKVFNSLCVGHWPTCWPWHVGLQKSSQM